MCSDLLKCVSPSRWRPVWVKIIFVVLSELSVLSPQLLVPCSLHTECSVHICGTKGDWTSFQAVFVCFSPKFIHHSLNYLLQLLACCFVCWACELGLFGVTQVWHRIRTDWWLQCTKHTAHPALTLPTILSQLLPTSKLHPATTNLLYPTQLQCGIHQDNFPNAPSWMRCPLRDSKIPYFNIMEVVYMVLQSRTYPTVSLIDS